MADDDLDASGDAGNGDADSRGDRRRGNGAASHLRRYGVFYAIAVVVAIVVAVLPSVGGDGDDDGGSDDGDLAASEDGADGSTDGPWRPGSGDIEHGTGTARSGVECEPGVGQIPDTVLAVPCLPEFTGDNGGATSRGVTEDTIRIVRRTFPSSANTEAVREELAEAGFATPEDVIEIRDQFIDYLNENYELYGRRVEIIEYESQFGDSTAEALEEGREGACQDATFIAEELDAFGVIGPGIAGLGGGPGSGPFSECAAERGLVVFSGGAYFPESWYEELHPYIWNDTMDCEQVARHTAAYITNRLGDRPATYAGDPELASRTRKFGSYTPEGRRGECNDLSRQILEDGGVYDGEADTPTVRYALDISRFAEQAQRAVVQWKADDVTTVVVGSDPISLEFLTQAAEDQDYHPEWFILGTAQQDSNVFGRTYNQNQADGHMFGMSLISGTDDLYGPDSDPARLYRKLNDGEQILGGTTGALFDSVHWFNLLQAAGPELTAENLARGVQRLPPLGGGDRVRYHFGDGHTAIKDAREIYWDGDAPPGLDEPNPEGELQGAFVETNDGERFLPDEWPAEDPPIYPDR
ncbi:MAG TPA: hypothetical protein VE575_04850 [Acidimicrobiales bacterium]|nr:hypothetical protein [Acidimicrobiales bacterium]